MRLETIPEEGTEDSHVDPPSPVNLNWTNAISRYYHELHKGGIEQSVIDKDLWIIQSPEDLFTQIEPLDEVQGSQSSPWPGAITQLRPILVALNDFVAVTSWVMGAKAKFAAVLWGSFRLILKFAQPVLADVIEMIESLEHALPQIKQYDNGLPMALELEGPLSDVYGEIVVFCAHAIVVLRNSPDIGHNKLVRYKFSKDIYRIIENIRKFSQQVDKAAGIITLFRGTKNIDTIAAPEDLKIANKPEGANLPCLMVPYGLNLNFFGRENELAFLRGALDPSIGTTLRAIRVHGLGGVGKTQLALHYANTSRNIYKIIAWIPAETDIRIMQAITNLASRLGLVKDSNEDDRHNLQTVREWLNKTDAPFLLIFDNLERSELLGQVWPTSDKGSVLITTRCPSQAWRQDPADLALSPFSIETSKAAFESLAGLVPVDQEDEAAMVESCALLGGLPLAMVQVSGFIRDLGCSYVEFLQIYKKSAERLFAKLDIPIEYNATALTTWEVSVERLSEDAKNLQNLLVFLDPDLIPERLLTDTTAGIEDPCYEFLTDEFDFGEAVAELWRTSLVRRLSGIKALSLHRIFQLAAFSKIPKEKRVYLFDLTVEILSFDFLNSWKAQGPYQGHGYDFWETCSAVLPHIIWLKGLSDKYKIKPDNLEKWAELLFRAGTYLWETQQPALAKEFFQYGLHAGSEMPAQISARESINGIGSTAVADVCDSVACSYTEIGDADNAFKYLQRATDIHNSHDPNKMSRTIAIEAMTYLRAGKPDESLAAIVKCWRLQGKTQQEIENSPYPKHSGDIMLLSRIYWLQGKKKQAEELTSHALKMRRGTFGENGGPRVADSLFALARILEDFEEYALAAGLLSRIVAMSGDGLDMRPHLARAYWFSANMEAKIDQGGNHVAELRKKAREARKTIDSREWPDDDTDEGFMRLVGWMLW
ncbi:unnamed protein product [Clonostachys solani]|uniref:NB-ARC domain-containing protein n=1 Tax=Clonostachys solani TaxID=160281 RepID=A0A9N9ZKU6_9HYPO|nr:unnamed protein product [Clonostachys solani]